MIKKRVDIKLKRGIRLIIVKPSWDYPITRGALIFHTGACIDPSGKSGLSSLFFDALNERQSIFDKMERLGARITASGSLTKSFITFAFLNSRLKKSFNLLSEFLKNFDIDNFVFDIVKRKRIDRLALLNEKPEHLINKKLVNIVYKNSSLSNPVSGTLDGVNNVNLNDIYRFYTDEFLKSSVDVIVVSSENCKKIEKNIQGILEIFSPKDIKIPEVLQDYHTENIVIKKEHLGNVFVSYFTVALSSEYLPLKLLSYILAEGSFNSRLIKRIREDLGLAYYISSTVSRGFTVNGKSFRGYFEIVAETGRENKDRLIKEMENAIKDLFISGITEDELEVAKSFYIGLERKRGETYKDVLNTIMVEVVYNLKKNYFIDLKDEIRNKTLKDIKDLVDRLKERGFSRIVLEEDDEQKS